MPIYQYQCTKCGKEMELVQSFAEKKAPLCVEPGCDGQQEMESVIGSTSFVLKGHGWARDGYSRNKWPV